MIKKIISLVSCPAFVSRKFLLLLVRNEQSFVRKGAVRDP
jgi:hypothetical protein